MFIRIPFILFCLEGELPYLCAPTAILRRCRRPYYAQCSYSVLRENLECCYGDLTVLFSERRATFYAIPSHSLAMLAFPWRAGRRSGFF